MHRWLLLVVICAVVGCANTPPPTHPAREDEDARLRAFVDEAFAHRLRSSPQLQTILDTGPSGKWDDISTGRWERRRRRAHTDLERLHRLFDRNELSRDGRLTYDLFEYQARRVLDEYRWRYHDFPVNPIHGIQLRVPTFLIHYHQIASEADALAYIERLRAVAPLFETLRAELRAREQRGIVAPRRWFPELLRSTETIVRGQPFDDVNDLSPLLADFEAKLASARSIPETRRIELRSLARDALLQSVGPAYRSLRTFLVEQEIRARDVAGAWSLPSGSDYYDDRLRRSTTTTLSAGEIHRFGLREVDRLRRELAVVQRELEVAGTLDDFFAYLRTSPSLYFSNDEAGRAAYLQRARAIIAAIEPRLPELFISLPRAALAVKAVESFREGSASKAYYRIPSASGSRPGVFYTNVHDMRKLPRYQLEALVFHEAIPGHHVQLALAQELETLPTFRRYGRFPAYTEGWALYAERLPKELGFYDDPHSEAGRLALELWRAARLVVDTGIHHYRWSRKRAIDYLVHNTPNPEEDAEEAVERYIVMPGQATAYAIGLRALLDLRRRAEAQLGRRFDRRKFHEVVLTAGPMPLEALREVVDRWLEQERARR